MNLKEIESNGAHGHTCFEFPELRRLNYFFGQMLGVQDFQTEQNFFREKLKLHNRCLHGYGVVCGLKVEPVPIPKHCDAKEQAEERKLWEELEMLRAQKAAAGPAPTSTPPPSALSDLDAQIETLRRQLGDFYRDHCEGEPRTCIRIDCGLALDSHGNELIIRRPLIVDLLQWLSPADHQRVKQGAHELYISVCFCEQPTDPVRPVLSGTCGASPDCTYGKWQEGVRYLVTVDPPTTDARCETCCEPCADECLLLARIDCFYPGHELHEHHIHNGVRRPLSLYQPTTITGVSWRTGHYYTQEQAKELLSTHEHRESHGRGLEIRFSRPVRASSIHPGVIDTWVIEGGRGRAGNIYNKAGELVDKPKDGLIDRIFYRDTTGETLEPGDRVLVTLRTEFILDECCRSVDGENTGGRVPVIFEYAEKFGLGPSRHHDECVHPPKDFGPWTSGNGTPGGVFQSWFYIREREREPRR